MKVRLNVLKVMSRNYENTLDNGCRYCGEKERDLGIFSAEV